MHINTLYTDLLSHLPQSASRLDLLLLLQAWTKGHIREWSSEIRDTILVDVVSRELSLFPIDESSLDADAEIRQLRDLPPHTRATLAMSLRDIIWDGITVETPITCPNCEGPLLKILHETMADEIVHACDQCAWVQTLTGAARFERPLHVEPVTSARLERYRETGQ